MPSATALRLRTGSAPGYPRQTGQTCVFGGAPNVVGQAQKIFERVRSRACTSRPMTASQSVTAGDYREALQWRMPRAGWLRLLSLAAIGLAIAASVWVVSARPVAYLEQLLFFTAL